MEELLQILKQRAPSTYRLASRIRLTEGSTGLQIAQKHEKRMSRAIFFLEDAAITVLILGIVFAIVALTSGNSGQAALYSGPTVLIASLVFVAARGLQYLRDRFYSAHLFVPAQDGLWLMFLPAIRQSGMASRWESIVQSSGRKLIYADYLVMAELSKIDSDRDPVEPESRIAGLSPQS